MLECAGRRYSVCSALSRINQMLNTISLPDTYFEGSGSGEAVVGIVARLKRFTFM